MEKKPFGPKTWPFFARFHSVEVGLPKKPPLTEADLHDIGMNRSVKMVTSEAQIESN